MLRGLAAGGTSWPGWGAAKAARSQVAASVAAATSEALPEVGRGQRRPPSSRLARRGSTMSAEVPEAASAEEQKVSVAGKGLGWRAGSPAGI